MKLPKLPLIALLSYFVLFSCSSDSEEPTPEPDVVAPEVDFSISGNSNSSSSEPTVVSNQIVVEIDAQDAGGVAKVEAFINNEKVGEDTTAPYQITIGVSNYASKNNLTAKFTDYTLKVTVTDTSGNESSKEEIIHIDNELPAITEVSLTDGQVRGGGTNAVTFSVSDNEGLSSVKTFLNDILLEEHTGDTYEINLNTLELSDGENVLRIEAIDLADNVIDYGVTFIADNTGPEITLNAIEENQILDESLSLTTALSDEYSSVTFFQILLTDVEVLTTDVEFAAGTEGNVEFDFHPNEYSTGEQMFILTASDALSNTTVLELPIEILRRLITINIPESFYNPDTARLFVFASDMSGQLLDVERIYSDTAVVTLHTSEETAGDFEYMLTFGEYISGPFGNASEFTTVQNIAPTVVPEMNLKAHDRFLNQTDSYIIPTANFDPDDEFALIIEGSDYYGGFHQEESGPTGDISIVQRHNVNPTLQSDSFYLGLFNYTLNEYSYTLLDSNISADLTINSNMFTSQGVEQRFYEPIMNGQAFESSTIQLYGYLSEDEFNNNLDHLIYNYGYGYLPINGIPYYISDVFSNYKYNVRINSDYFTERTGEPATSFTPVDWTIDYTFLNNQFEISQTGSEHTVGKIFIDSDTPEIVNDLNISYRWNLVFDSQNMNQVILPEIPEELQSWGFYPLYENDGFKVQQVEMKSYEGILDYNGFLNGVIKDNKFPYTISPKMESKFKSSVEGYYNRAPNFLLD